MMTTSKRVVARSKDSTTLESGMIQTGTAVRYSTRVRLASSLSRGTCFPVPLPIFLWSPIQPLSACCCFRPVRRSCACPGELLDVVCRDPDQLVGHQVELLLQLVEIQRCLAGEVLLPLAVAPRPFDITRRCAVGVGCMPLADSARPARRHGGQSVEQLLAPCEARSQLHQLLEPVSRDAVRVVVALLDPRRELLGQWVDGVLLGEGLELAQPVPLPRFEALLAQEADPGFDQGLNAFGGELARSLELALARRTAGGLPREPRPVESCFFEL